MAAEAHAAYAAHQAQWLASHPYERTAGIFMPVAQRGVAYAFGTLVHALAGCAFHVREPQVATAKLAWWREELGDAALGRARHPVTQRLFADAEVRESDPTLWPALASGALASVDAAGAGTLGALLASLEPFFSAVARAEGALFVAGRGNVEADAALWTISHLVGALPSLAQTEGPLPLPLNLLARHGLTRADLARPGADRNRLLKDFLDELTLESRGALGVAAPRALALRLRARMDAQRIACALRATDPLAWLRRHPAQAGWRCVFVAWHLARSAQPGVG